MKYWRCLAGGWALGRIGAADCGLRLKPGGWSLWRGETGKECTGYMRLAVLGLGHGTAGTEPGQIVAWQLEVPVPGRDLVGDSCAGPAANQHARRGT